MTENNSDPSQSHSEPGQPGEPQPAETRPRKKKRRWILKTIVALVVLIVVLVLLAPTILSTGVVKDMVVSTVNSSALNGKLAIKNWSFGWTSGVHIEGVTLDDANNIHLLSVADISVPISLVKATTGNIDLGDVYIKGVDFNAELDPQGQLNILKVIKPSKTPPSNQPSKLPNVKGTIHVENVTGTFQDDVHRLAIGLPQEAPLNATVTIAGINQPIQESADLGLQLDEKNLVKVKVDGNVSAIQNNLVDVSKLSADQTITLSDGDLAAVTQVLRSLHLDMTVAGKMDGKIVAKVNTLDDISADVGIKFAALSAGGKQLAGDTVALQSCDVGIKASLASSGGKNARIKVDMPIDLTPKDSTQVNHILVYADAPQDSLLGTADVFKTIAAQLMKTPARGETVTAIIPGSGIVKITADIDVANFVNQVPNLVHVEQGTRLTSGTLAHETTITLANDQAVIATDTKLKNFAGTSNGSAVHINDIDASAGLTAVGGDHPGLHGIQVGLNSAFADIKGGGATLAKMSFEGKSNLENVQQQAGQFFDLGAMLHAPAGSHVSMQGTLAFDAHTDGDLTSGQGNVAVAANFSAAGVKVIIPGKRTIDEPKLTATLAANLHQSEAGVVDEARDVKVAVNSPAVNFAADADVKAGGKFGASVPSFKISQGVIDLRLAQEEFGGALSMFVPAPADGQPPTLVQRIADNSVKVASGVVNISGEGKFDQTGFGFQTPLTIQVQPVELTVVDELGTAQTIHMPAASVVIAGNGTVSASNVATVKNLTVTTMVGTASSPLFDLQLGVDASMPLAGQGPISASRIELAKCDGDLPGLQSAMGPVLQLFAPANSMGQPSIVQMVAENVLECTSGKLSGSMLASYDGQTLTIAKPLTIAIDGLTVERRDTNTTPLKNESLRATVSASVSTAAQQVRDLNVTVDSSFARKVSVSNGQIALATQRGGELVPASPLEMVRSLKLEVDDADLVRLDGELNALINQAAAPAPGEKVVVVVPPPEVTSGTASLKLDISQSGNTTTASVSEAVVHNLAIKSGASTTSWPGDVTAKLSAELDVRPDATADMSIAAQVANASVTSLTVNSGIGTTVGLADGKPIVLSNLADPDNMRVQGGIEVDGDVARVARLAEAFGGAKPNAYPYFGHFHFNESMTKEPGQPRLQLAGGGNITKFVVKGAAGPDGTTPTVFSEDNISIKNPLAFDFKTFSLIIDKNDPISVALNSSGALGLELSGAINDVPLKRQIAQDNPIVVRLSYDLAKIWPIAKPMLSPSQQQQLADLQISGKQTRVIKVTGSYPADKSFGDAVAMLQAGGYFTIDSISTQGITVQNFDIPFTLSDGVLQTVYPDQPETSNAPHPATCNSGSLDIGVMQVDLRSNPMLLSMPRLTQGRRHSLLRNVSINPAMSKSFLGKVLNNPAFVNANQAQGLVSVEIANLDKIPLSDLLTESSPLNKGTAEVHYSVTGLRLGSELLAVFGNDSVAASINDAVVKYANGRVVEDTTMMIDGNKPLRFAGTVVLATEQFAPMTVYIPPALFGRLIPPNARQYVPDQVVVPMKGDMNHPKIDLAQAVAETVKKAAPKAIINGLLQGLQHAAH